MACATPARAQREPVYVVPSRPDVPVIINGYDASYTVVEGEWGLDRPGATTPVIFGPAVLPAPYRPGYYFPRAGRPPAYGRHEIIPAAQHPLPRPAEDFHRYWGSPVDQPPAALDPPVNPPAVIVAPQFNERRADRQRPDNNRPRLRNNPAQFPPQQPAPAQPPLVQQPQGLQPQH